MSARSSLLVGLGGFLVAGLGAIGVSSSDGPRLGFDDLDPWLVIYALGVLTALGAGPYGLYDRAGISTTDPDARWDLALSVWGACALFAGAIFVGIGLMFGFDPAEASGALVVVGAGACALVVGVLLLFMLGAG